RAVERPDLQAARQPVALAEAVRNALDLLEPECRRRQVEPALHGGAGLKVLADPVALEQIVHNLLLNALQALEGVPPAQRALKLGLEAEAGAGVLRVEDSGPGIPDEQLAHVFEPFFSTRRGGLGLGLSLCETLAAGMGGSLSAQARAPRGAVFRLALPLAGA
ncbi:MAG TPA: ATP-binding protein, partial [Rubrivivax sp.]|nr:ATP-binding protein [Rubrivivax sp.]